jgi:hypothetical protein
MIVELRERNKKQKRSNWQKIVKLNEKSEQKSAFKKTVEGLGSGNEGVKVGAAILLRTFLQPGYEQFYRQAFDLAVVHLRLREVDPSPPEPVNSLSQALITVLREAFPLARDGLGKQLFQSSPQTLDATGVQLDYAYLSQADLRGIWMPGAHLQGHIPGKQIFAVQSFNIHIWKAYIWKRQIFSRCICGGQI